MKCPKCGAEVEKGFLFCQNCLTEIPWVPEYSTVETLMKQSNREKEALKHERLIDLQRAVRRKLFRKRTAFRAALLVLLLGTALAVLVQIFHANSFSYQYRLALRSYHAGDFASCDAFLEKALEKRPESAEGNLLLAKVMEAQGNLESAEKILKTMLQENSHNEEFYREYLKILDGQGETEEIRNILKACEDEEVLEACGEYVSREPEFSVEGGTFTKSQLLSLDGNRNRVYYTLDGSEPTQNSRKYRSPIVIGEGTTIVKAFSVNEKNIPSDVVTEKYVVVTEAPGDPEILPPAGSYKGKTSITVKVPEGCVAYYAFDTIPDENSTVYTKPVSMPEGVHAFNCYLVAANGKRSELVSRIYELYY